MLQANSVAPFPRPVKLGQSSYTQILKCTAMIGGVSVVNIAMGIVRTKAMALLLGPAGVGLAGLYASIVPLAQNICGMGVSMSGVRQIAAAAASNDMQHMARTVVVLRRASLVLGIIGAVLLVTFSKSISRLTFGDDHHAAGVSLVSIALLFTLVSSGQTALIQGLRRLSDLAQMSIAGAVAGTLVTIVLVYFLRQSGIVISLVSVAALTLLTSWWYSRTVRLQACSFTFAEGAQEAAELLTLGLALISSSLMGAASAYLVKITVQHQLGLEAMGFYQSAWTLGGFYVGIILQAMGTDFYPRLTASVNDHITCNRLVNEQARVSLLLAGPGVMATLIFAPVVIAAFYSAKFGAAVGPLRWMCLGTMMQVITWPMGFIILAKGARALLFWCEFAWALVSVALAWFCVQAFGLIGTGMAFFASYVFHLLLIYPVVRYLTGFQCSADNMATGAFYLLLVAAVFCSNYVLPPIAALLCGTCVLVFATVYSLRVLLTLTASELPAPLRRAASLLRTLPAESANTE